MLITETLLVVLPLVFIFWYIQFHIKRRKLYRLAEQFDGPKCLPIIGNALKCLIPLTEMNEEVLKGCTYYASPARLWFGPYLSVFIWDPENLKIVLNSPSALAKQPYLYKLVEEVTGHGLITSPVDEWKRHRKLIAPLFNQQCLESFFEIFCAHSKRLLDAVKEKTNAGVFDVQEYLMKYSMDSVTDTLLEFEDKSGRSNSQAIFKFIQPLFEAAMTRMSTMWYFFDAVFDRSVVGKNMRKAKDDYRIFMDTIIEQWKKESITKLVNSNDQNNVTEHSKPRKLIEHLLSISDGNDKLSDEELRGEINTIIVAGLETTSSAIGFALIMLGMHPDIQEKLFQELSQVTNNKPVLQLDDLKQLDYLERVIKETLRIFPPAPGVARCNDQEIQLKDHIIPAYSTIVVALIGLHRNPDVWPNPTRFDPDRFLPEEEAKRHPYCFMPFLAGPRNCVGMRFAWMSLKIALSHFVLKYKIRTDYKSVEDVRLTIRLMYEATNGYRISLTPR